MRLSFPSRRASSGTKPIVYITILDDKKREVVTQYLFDITKMSGRPDTKGSNYPFPYDTNAVWHFIADHREEFDRQWESDKPEIFTYNLVEDK